MNSRKLILLRIDDGLSRSRTISESTPERDVPPTTIALYERDVYDWESALTLWAKYDEAQGPDLVIADVHFDLDRTSPLAASSIVKGNHLPTGLSHLKPFAALSRPAGSLIGVGLHTADRELWERLCNSGDATERCVGHLAAHEIGELGAILGDQQLVDQLVEQNSMQPLWNWIKINTGGNPREAIRIALRNYRQRLLDLTDLSGDKPTLFVLPDDLAQMLNWCGLMEQGPQPMSAANDCSLVLTAKDGRQDSISLASLFADVEEITRLPLDPECFAISPAGTPAFSREKLCRLDHNGNPRIGAFVSSLGTLQRVYADAVQQVSQFPLRPPQVQPKNENLRTLVPENGTGLLVRGFVVLFQLLRIEQVRFEEWVDLFDNAKWNPRNLAFIPAEPSPIDNLRTALQRLTNLVRFHKGAKFTRADVFDPDVDINQGLEVEWVTNVSSNEVDEPWVKWHFDRLVDAGLISRTAQDEYVLSRSRSYLDVPPFPALLDKVDETTNSKDSSSSLPQGCAAFAKSWKGWLRDSLGFAGDDGAIGQVLCDAFGRRGAANANERRIKGNEFLAQLKAGAGPPWLISLCQKYAHDELHWLSKDTWPRWLNSRLH